MPFLHGVRDALLGRGVAAMDIPYEVFGPDPRQADSELSPALLAT